MEKVILSKEIADALNDVSNFYSPVEIIAEIVKDIGCSAYGTKMSTLVKMYHSGTLDIDELMNALVNGYEIEKTPEEKIKEYYDSHLHRGFGNSYSNGVLTSVNVVLNFLNKTIEGIND
jgi:hypothetical protein